MAICSRCHFPENMHAPVQRNWNWWAITWLWLIGALKVSGQLTPGRKGINKENNPMLQIRATSPCNSLTFSIFQGNFLNELCTRQLFARISSSSATTTAASTSAAAATSTQQQHEAHQQHQHHHQQSLPRNLAAGGKTPIPSEPSFSHHPCIPIGLFVFGADASLNSPNCIFLRLGFGFGIRFGFSALRLFHFQLNGAAARVFQLISTCKQIHFDYFNICLLIAAAVH